MGRAKQHDPGEVLGRMTEVFWQRGYKATSLRELEQATGVGRKGLLREYGSKEAMFMRALQHYVEIKAVPEGEPLNAEPPGLDNIRAFFRARHYRERDDWGCLAALTILEKESAPPEATRLAVSVYANLEGALLRNLMPAVAAGKIGGAARAKQMAVFLLNALLGIIVAGRAGRTNRELRKVVDVILATLPD